jgi:acetoin utilization protein AcuB
LDNPRGLYVSLKKVDHVRGGSSHRLIGYGVSMSNSIQEFMTKSPHTIGDEQTLDVAKKEMQQFRIRHLPVLRGGMCVGILSERDVTLLQGDGEPLHTLQVKDVCSLDVYTVKGDTPLRDVVLHLANSSIGSAIVIDDREKVIGIFTLTDACRALATLLG